MMLYLKISSFCSTLLVLLLLGCSGSSLPAQPLPAEWIKMRRAFIESGDSLQRHQLATRLALAVAEGASLDSITSNAVFFALPATDSLWARRPEAAAQLAARFSHLPRHKNFFDRGAHKHYDKHTRAVFLSQLVALAFQKQWPEYAAWYAELKENYATDADAQAALQAYARTNQLAVNQPVPDFSFTKLEGSGRITSQTVSGKVYLLDFWATWCRPCLAEMPRLRELYKRYHTRGFEIVSISLDRSAQDVLRFLGPTPDRMPWLKAFTAGEFNSPEAVRFQVKSIPHYVLVNDKGQVVALREDAIGEKLSTWLEANLPK